MDQARLEKYAGWLVQNKDKKGSPEFETVAKAYKSLRSGTPDAPAPKSYNAADVPSAALQNAPASAGRFIEGIGNAIIHPIDAIQTIKDAAMGGIERLRPQALKDFGAGAFPTLQPDQATLDREKQVSGEVGEHYKNRYGGWENIKRTLAEDPVGAAADVASIAGPKIIPPVAKAVVKIPGKGLRAAKKLNKSKVDYPEVSGDVARDLKLHHESGEYNLPRFAGDETKLATNKLHTNYKTEIDTDYATVSHMLDPKKAANEADRLVRVEAEKAFRSGDHLRMDKSLKSEIAAVDSLVGHTKEGRRIVNNLKKQVEVGRLGSKVKGGLSQFTDELNPLSTGGGRFGVKGLPQVFTAANIGASGLAGGTNLIAQGAAVTTGRLTDLMTRRGNLPRKYMQDNAKAPKSPSTDGLVDVAGNQRAAKALEELQVKLDQSLRKKEALSKQTEKVETKQAKETYKEASNENKRFDDVVAASKRKQQAAEALVTSKKRAEAKNAAIETKHQIAAEKANNALKAKKAIEDAKLKAASEKAARAEAKAAADTRPRDANGKIINRNEGYQESKLKIETYQKEALAIADRTASKPAKKVITAVEGALRKIDTKSARNQKNREEVYRIGLSKLKNKHDRALFKKAIRPLVDHWTSGVDLIEKLKV